MRSTILRKNNGITLIALVVTIIVLIILAGVSLNLVLGQNGIIQRAKDAKMQQKVGEVKEEISLKIFEKEMEKVEAGEKLTQGEVEAILTPYGEVIKNADGTIKSLKPTGMTEEIAIEKLYAGEISKGGSSGGTFASKITSANYGEYVDLETTILPRTNGVITLKLGAGATDGKEQPLTDWRIFYEDNDGGIYLMLSDYMPYDDSTLGTGLRRFQLSI